MQKQFENRKIALEQTHLADNFDSGSPIFFMQTACHKKSKCCEKYKRKGKHCGKCPKR
jgi:hypothetical protein